MSSPIRWPKKDPDERLDYTFNWSTRGLGDDTIVTTTATVISGAGAMSEDGHAVGTGLLDENGDAIPAGQGTRTWLIGGTASYETKILLRIVTAAGREMDQTMVIKCEPR